MVKEIFQINNVHYWQYMQNGVHKDQSEQVLFNYKKIV